MSSKAWMRSLVAVGSMFGAVAPALAQTPPPPAKAVVVETVVVTDASITQTIKAKLEGNPVVKNAQVTIASTDGFVTLVGSVPNQFARDAVLEATRTTPGVLRIDDQLRFDITSPSAPARM